MENSRSPVPAKQTKYFLKKCKAVENKAVECKAMYSAFTSDSMKGETKAMTTSNDEVVRMSDLGPFIKTIEDLLSSKKSVKGEIKSMTTSNDKVARMSDLGPIIKTIKDIISSKKSVKGEIKTMTTSNDEVVRMSDLGPLIKTIKDILSSKKSGTLSLAHNTHRPLVIDSGASHHMISDRNLISDVRPASGSVVIANGDKIQIEGIWNLMLCDKESKDFYMPGFTSNLLSVSKATSDLNCQVVFRPNDVEFQDLKTGNVIGKGVTKDGLYNLLKSKSPLHNTSCFTSASTVCDSTTWHARLGHPHSRALELMMPNIT